jgi:hypothetical protein
MLLRYSCKTWQQKSVDRDTSNEGPMLEAGTEIEEPIFPNGFGWQVR